MAEIILKIINWIKGLFMPGDKVNLYSTADVNLTKIMETLDKQRKGLFRLSITEYNTSTLPEIEAGSIVEVAGALFKFAAQTACTGAHVAGYVYIRLEPTPDGLEVDPILTNEEPEWNADKQGWYKENTNYRYVVKMYYDGTDYTSKVYLDGPVQSGQFENRTTLTGSITINNGATQAIATTFSKPIEAITMFQLSGPVDIYVYSMTIVGAVFTITLKNRTGTNVSGSWAVNATAKFL